MNPKKKPAWQEDEIMQELHRVREKLGKELQKDPEKFYERMDRHTKEAGIRFTKLKPQPVPLKKAAKKQRS